MRLHLRDIAHSAVYPPDSMSSSPHMIRSAILLSRGIRGVQWALLSCYYRLPPALVIGLPPNEAASLRQDGPSRCSQSCCSQMRARGSAVSVSSGFRQNKSYACLPRSLDLICSDPLSLSHSLRFIVLFCSSDIAVLGFCSALLLWGGIFRPEEVLCNVPAPALACTREKECTQYLDLRTLLLGPDLLPVAESSASVPRPSSTSPT